MTSEAMSLEVQRFLKEADALQWTKNADYHPEKVAFLEILRTASETGISVEQDLWAKIRKQYIALRSFVIEGKTASESPRSRMMDIAVYMGMFAFWVENRKEILSDALVYVEEQTTCELEGQCFTPGAVACDRCRFKLWLVFRAS